MKAPAMNYSAVARFNWYSDAAACACSSTEARFLPSFVIKMQHGGFARLDSSLQACCCQPLSSRAGLRPAQQPFQHRERDPPQHPAIQHGPLLSTFPPGVSSEVQQSLQVPYARIYSSGVAQLEEASSLPCSGYDVPQIR